MKKYSLFLVTIFVFTLQCKTPKHLDHAQNTIEYSIKDQVQNGAFVVDVRTPAEFEEGSIEGAVNIPLDQIEGRTAEFKNKTAVIVFCRTGNRSNQAIKILEDHGIKNTVNGINIENMEKALQ